MMSIWEMIDSKAKYVTMIRILQIFKFLLILRYQNFQFGGVVVFGTNLSVDLSEGLLLGTGESFLSTSGATPL